MCAVRHAHAHGPSPVQPPHNGPAGQSHVRFWLVTACCVPAHAQINTVVQGYPRPQQVDGIIIDASTYVMTDAYYKDGLSEVRHTQACRRDGGGGGSGAQQGCCSALVP